MVYNGYEYNLNARLGRGITLFGGGMVERMLANVCDEQANPNLLLYCDQSESGIPFRSQFKLAGSIPVAYGFTVSVALQSLPGYLFGTSAQYALTGVSGPSGITTNNPPNGASTVWLISRTTRYTTCPGNSAQQGCVVGNLVNPNMTVASMSVPLVAPMTEYGDRINQLDLNIVRTFHSGRMTIQPKLDVFNVLNVAPVISVRTLNYGTAAYQQPSSVLSGRVIQLGGIIRF
jgi:hypothetical protein